MKNLIESIRQRYQPQAEATMMKDDGKIVHNCAKHVEHAEYGRGNCISEEHAAPDRNGNIAWYDIMFEHGLERGVPTAELKILHAESHMHANKKAKKVMENDGNLANNAKPYDKVTHGDVIAGRLGKDEYGGKKKKPEVKEEAGGMPETPTSGGNAAVSIDPKQAIKKKAMSDAMSAANKAATGPLATAPVTKQGVTKEEAEIDEAAWGKDKMANLQAAHDRHSEKAIAANRAGDDKAAKVHQSKMGMIKTQMNNLRKEDVQISLTAEEWDQLDELSKNTLGSYVKKAKEHAVGLGVGLGVAAMKRKDRSDVADKLKQRTKNIDKAVDRITKEEFDVDEETYHRPVEYVIAEADKNYDAHFKAMMKKHGIKHPGELKSDEEKKAFFNKVDAGFNAKNEDVVLEAMMASDIMKIKDAHKKAGNKISDEKTGSKGGESHHSFVVTAPSGKRTRHIYHGTTKKVETMSAAPRSKEAKETGEDDDDK